MPDANKHKPEKHLGKGFPDTKFTEEKAYHEKRHMLDRVAESTKTSDNEKLHKKTFDSHNRKTDKEFSLEETITAKKRILTLAEKRGNLPLASLGDKVYKAVEYEKDFFLPGGLVAGSTNALKPKSSGNGKTVDFYSGLNLDTKLNPNSKNYATVCKE